MNYLKTGILLIALTLLFVWVGGMVGGPRGASIAFIFALVMNAGTYWFSDKIVLAMYRAAPVSREEAPELYGILEELTREAKLPMPRLYAIPQQAPNAFATGRDGAHAVVCVTRGIVNALDHDEIKGVLAHELAHVRNRDILIMTVTAVIAGTIMMIANMARWAAIFGGSTRDRGRGGGNAFSLLALAILAPLAAMLIQLAISRSREYHADATGARFARDPRGLASALKKLEAAAKTARLDASPQTAHLFIVNPLSGNALMRLFSTHPPVEERVKRLESMR